MATHAAHRTNRRSRSRRVSGGRSTGIRWDRFGRVVLLVVLGLVIFNYLGPAKRYWEQRHVAAKQGQELRALQGRNRVLKDRVLGLTDPRLLEQHARQLGMVKRGEKPLVVESIPTGQ